MKISRRQFVKVGGSALACGGLQLGGTQRAQAAGLSGYKALVCMYLTGGNDGFNWLIPTSTAGYSTYKTSRSVLALPMPSASLTGTASDGYTYGLHASCPELMTMFNAGTAAFVCNVGTLIVPTTVAQAQGGTVALPPQLFSHIDQTTEWMTAYPQSTDKYGWAGRVADLLPMLGISTNLSVNINVGGTNYFQEGLKTNPYALGISGAPKPVVSQNPYYRGGARSAESAALVTLATTDPNPLVSEYAGIWNNAVQKAATVATDVTASGDFATVFPAAQINDWNLSAQLHEVARIIKAQTLIGDTHEIFFVQLGGFDTHDGQVANQAQLLRYVSQYVSVFFQAMTEIGQQSNVTLFTMSEFGRTLQPNNDGTDHGWGSHHLVAGGAVKGGRYYGSMPSLVLAGANDYGTNGRMVPTTSVDQYAATLAQWFGVPLAQLSGIFPNLSHFPSATLGFF